MRTITMRATALFALLSGWSISSGAQTLKLIGDQVAPTLTYATQDQLQRSRTNGAYTGVGTLFVTTLSTATTNLGRVCTGSLVAGNVGLTAAHCLFDYSDTGAYDPVRSVTFYLPSLGERSVANTFTASGWTVNPNYTGSVVAGNDVSLFTLTSAATGHDVYGIYSAGLEIGSVFTRVGTGTIGGPNGTGTGGLPTDFDQRSGVNSFDLYGDNLFGDVSHDVLLSDFDDGTATHNVFGRAGINPKSPFNLGVRNAAGVELDSDSSPGDSGGPDFINGLIAGITSFGVTGAVIDGSCGGAGNVDPSADANGGCTNSSIGEIAGDARVSAYAGFIQSYIVAASVPEPSSWLVAILGLGLSGAGLRRSRRRERRVALGRT